MKKTKYCQNVGPRHLRGDSPSKHYCSECYGTLKARYEQMEKHGGPVEVLRGARLLAGGSFGYERSKREKETNLRAFFYCVMTHIPQAEADQHITNILSGPQGFDMVAQGGEVKRIITG